MFNQLENEYAEFLKDFKEYSHFYIQQRRQKNVALESLWKSFLYSFENGGKRFRPFLSYLTAQSIGVATAKVRALTLALEFIHTYSLIHDDLPCMDNDDFRRGQPTNHKVYGEALALLAGDALQTEAFACLADDSENNADIKIQLIQLVSNNVGPLGMVGGQVLDMLSSKDISFHELEKIHRLKTGALISAAVTGVGVIKHLDIDTQQNLERFSWHLGMAFQIKDDLLDGLDHHQDHKSYLKVLGSRQTEKLLEDHSLLALEDLKKINLSSTALQRMVDFNIHRKY